MPERYHPSRFSPLRRRELAEYARCGCMVSATMLERDISYTEALDYLAVAHGLPPYVKRKPATVISLDEVRRLLAEAEANPETHTNGGPDAA